MTGLLMYLTPTISTKQYKTMISQRGLHKYRTSGTVAHTIAINPPNRLSQPIIFYDHDNSAEMVLWNVTNYMQSWLDDRLNLPRAFSRRPTSWLRHMGRGLAFLLLSDNTQALQSLNAACSEVAKRMNNPYHDILRELLISLCNDSWSDFAEVRLHMIRYIAKLACVKLGLQHPITAVLFHLGRADVLDQVSDQTLHIILEVAKKAPVHLHKSEWKLSHVYCSLLIDRGDHESALWHLDQLREICVKEYGLADPLTRCTIVQRGEIYYNQGLLDLSKSQFLECVTLVDANYSNSFPDAIAIEAAARLAQVYVETGEHESAYTLSIAALNNTWTSLHGLELNSYRLGLKAMLNSIIDATLEKTQPLPPHVPFPYVTKSIVPPSVDHQPVSRTQPDNAEFSIITSTNKRGGGGGGGFRPRPLPRPDLLITSR